MELIRTIRQRCGLSQRVLAQRAGLSFRGVQLLESPAHDARLSSLERVVQAFGLPRSGVRRAVARVLLEPPGSLFCASLRILEDGEESWRHHLMDSVDAVRRSRSAAELEVSSLQARESTKDVDAVFAPTREIRDAARVVARTYGVADDWLNDAAKGFLVSSPPRIQVLDLPNLRVWAPTAEYMLAMKCVSAQFDTHDAGDVAFLIRHLGLVEPAQVFERIARYYPHERVPAKTRLLVKELLGAADGGEGGGA